MAATRARGPTRFPQGRITQGIGSCQCVQAMGSKWTPEAPDTRAASNGTKSKGKARSCMPTIAEHTRAIGSMAKRRAKARKSTRGNASTKATSRTIFATAKALSRTTAMVTLSQHDAGATYTGTWKRGMKEGYGEEQLIEVGITKYVSAKDVRKYEGSFHMSKKVGAQRRRSTDWEG